MFANNDEIRTAYQGYLEIMANIGHILDLCGFRYCQAHIQQDRESDFLVEFFTFDREWRQFAIPKEWFFMADMDILAEYGKKYKKTPAELEALAEKNIRSAIQKALDQMPSEKETF